MKSKVIFYADVDPKYLKKWEYYIADIDMLKRAFNEVLFPKNLKEVLFLLIKHPQIKIYCWWWHRSLPVILLGWAFRKTTYCTGAIHMYDYSGNRTFHNRTIIYKILTIISLKLASKNIFISKDQYLAVTSALKVNNPIFIYSSLTKVSKEINKEFILKKRINNEEIKLLFVGWLSEFSIKRKSLLLTLEAIKLIKDKINKKIIINICGSKSDGIDSLNKYINYLSLKKNVNLNLDISQDSKNNYYLSSDLLITPSYMEGFGNSSLEAMSFGCPVLVSRFGASPEVVGDTGYIINDITAKAIAKVIQDYSQLSNNIKLRMRTKAFNRAHSKFSFERKLSSFKKIINES